MFLFIAGSLVMAGCKKEGCTDSKATNFDEKAKKDDGSCKFATVVDPNDPDNPDNPDNPANDAEKPTVIITNPSSTLNIKAGVEMKIEATLNDNVGVTSWTYSISDPDAKVQKTATANLTGAKKELVSVSYTIPATWAAGTYKLTITASDAKGNVSTAAEQSIEVEAAEPEDKEAPTIVEPKKTFPTSGTNISKGTQATKGAKFDIEVSDNVEIESITVILWNTTKSTELDKEEYTGVGAKTWKKNVHLQYDNGDTGDKAKVKVIAKDKAGNEKELLSTQEYNLTLS